MINYSKIWTTLILITIISIGKWSGVIPKTEYFRLMDITININSDKTKEILYTTKKQIEQKKDLITAKPTGEKYLTELDEGVKKIYKIEKSEEPSYFEMLNRSPKIKWLYYLCMVAVLINFFILKSKLGLFGSLALTIVSLFTYTVLADVIISDLDWIGWGGFCMFCFVSYGIKIVYSILYSN